MSDTPRSDAQVSEEYKNWEGNDWVPLYFARQLEREVERLTRERDALVHQLDLRDAAGSALQQDVDDLRAEVERLRGKYEPIENVCAYTNGRLRCLHLGTVVLQQQAEVERLRALLRECAERGVPAAGLTGPHQHFSVDCILCRIRAALDGEQK